LCQVITTFSTGITALNGLTAQVQYFQVGTSGTDFNISSTTATHTFNIPDASATARGLITIGTQTIAGTKTFSDATKNNGGIFLQNASSNSLAGYMNLGGLTNGVKFTSGGGVSNSFTLPSATGYTFTFPNATGTLALTSDIPSITGLVPYTGATGSVNLGAYLLTASGVDSVGYTARGSGTLSGYLIIKQGTTYLGNVVGYNSINANARKYVFISDVDGTNYKSAIFELSSLTNNTDRTYTLPDASGTIALVGGSGVGTVTSVAALTIGTSGTDVSSTVANSTTTPVITLNIPSASATNRGLVTTTTQTLAGVKTFSSNSKFDGAILLKNNVASSLAGYVGLSALSFSGNKGINIDFDTYSIGFYFNGTLPYNYTFPNANGTVALTSDIPDVSGYVTLITAQTITGAKTFTSALNGTSAVFSSSVTASNGVLIGNGGATATTNYLPKFTGASTIGNSLVYDNGSGIGIGTNSFSSLLHIEGNSSGDGIQFRAKNNNLANGNKYISLFVGGTATGISAWNNSGVLESAAGTGSNLVISNYENGPILFQTNDRNTKLTLTGTGNLGLGVTPSAWGSRVAMQISPKLALWGDVNQSIISHNFYTDGTDKFIGSGYASVYTQSNGSHIWLTSTTSGTAGAAITLTQAMTLTAAGELLVGTSTLGTSTAISDLLTLGKSGSSSIAVNFTNGTATRWGFIYANSAKIVYGSFADVAFESGASSSEKMRIFSGGNVLIQTGGTFTDNGYKLDVNGTGRFVGNLTVAKSDASNDILLKIQQTANYTAAGLGIIANNDGGAGYNFIYSATNGGTEHWRIGGLGSANTLAIQTGGTTRLTIASTGAATFSSTCTATGFFESSDSRLKTLIQDNYQTKGIASITPKLYTKNGKVELGYYAQDFVGVLDSAVSKGSDDMLSLSYREVLVAKVYALEQEIKELKAKMN
jgi:hypothetical protein